MHRQKADVCAYEIQVMYTHTGPRRSQCRRPPYTFTETSALRNKLVSSNYLEVLNKRALEPLKCEDIDGTIAVLDAYGLQREHLAALHFSRYQSGMIHGRGRCSIRPHMEHVLTSQYLGLQMR